MAQHVCGLCKTDINDGAIVCVGCQGTVIYGATKRELDTAFKIGAALGAIGTGTAWIRFFGYSVSALVAIVVGAVVLGGVFMTMTKRSHLGEVRTFRRF